MYIGIDLGTSAVKASCIDDDGRVIATASGAAAGAAGPQPGLSEQDPESWWQATLAGFDELAKQAPREMAAVRGIGLSGQMHGATLLDKAGKVLRPCILWNDGAQRRGMRASSSAPGPSCTRITGNLAMPGFTAPKLMWVQRARAGDLRARRHGAAAQGLRALPAERRVRRGHVGRLRHAVARRRQARLVGRGARRDRHVARADAARWSKAARRPATLRAGAGAALGHDARAGDRRRRAATTPPARSALGAMQPGDAFVSLGTSGVLWATTAGFAPNTDARGPRLLPCRARTPGTRWA